MNTGQEALAASSRAMNERDPARALPAVQAAGHDLLAAVSQASVQELLLRRRFDTLVARVRRDTDGQPDPVGDDAWLLRRLRVQLKGYAEARPLLEQQAQLAHAEAARLTAGREQIRLDDFDGGRERLHETHIQAVEVARERSAPPTRARTM